MIKLLITPSEKANALFLKTVSASKKNTLCVLSSKSLISIVKAKVENACKRKKCFFIDTVNEDVQKNEGSLFIPPSNLTGLSIAINEAQQSFRGKSTVIFDAISGLAIRNDPKVLIKFFLFLIKKTADWGTDLVLILPEKTMPDDFVAILSSSVDKVEKIK